MGVYSAILRNVFLPYLLSRDGNESALRHWRFFERSQHWPRQRLLDYQWQKLTDLLKYSYENCPYYTKVFDDGGLTPDSFKSLEDLSLLPILTRDIVYEQRENLLSRKYTKSALQEFSTGGTTGQQAIMYRDQESFNIKLGASWRFEGWMGRRPCDKMACFWPAYVDFVEHETMKMRIKNRYFIREMVFNAGTSAEAAMAHFHRELTRFGARYLKVFPASFYGFTEYVEQKKLTLPRIRALMSTGEVLYDHQRKRFEQALGCPVFDMYGSREVGNTACECPDHQGLHIAMETSIVEFVQSGRNVAFGEEGEIIITDLTNYAMPMIRYRINDYGIPVKGNCSCGRELVMMSPVVGRLEDSFWGPDGTRHSGNVLGIHLTTGEDGIVLGQAQFIQKSLTHFHVRITDRPEPSPEMIERLVRRMKEIIGDGIDVTVEIVAQIPREKSGKFRYVICEIKGPDSGRSPGGSA